MKNILPRLTLVGIVGAVCLLAPSARGQNAPPASSAPASRESRQAAESLLAQALSQLARHDSVHAKIRQQIELGGHELISDGVYYQSISGRDVLLRMELKVQVGDQLCVSLQVSDGRNLWIEQQCGEQRGVKRIDARQVASLLRKQRPRLEELGGGRLPLGGLPEWLHSLAVNFEFSLVGETELAGVPVSMLVGTWRQEHLLEMLPGQKERLSAGQPADLSQLPAHAPQEIVLLLGQDDCFPYLIDYRRYQRASDTAPLQPRSILRTQIYEVRIGGPIDLRQFVYQAGHVDVADATEATAKLLGGRGQRQAQARAENANRE